MVEGQSHRNFVIKLSTFYVLDISKWVVGAGNNCALRLELILALRLEVVEHAVQCEMNKLEK